MKKGKNNVSVSKTRWFMLISSVPNNGEKVTDERIN